MARRPADRNEELSTKASIRKKLIELYYDVDKGFDDQRDRADETLDNWDLFDCRLGERQFYNGNSQLFVPFVKDAVNARKTRFTNQIFPVSGRYVEVTTGEADPPHAIMALIEGYVRKAKLRTQVMPALCKNGDIEGQYSVYVDWRKSTRNVTRREKVPSVSYRGADVPELGEVDDYVSEEEADAAPHVEVLHDADLLILPATADGIEDAIEAGGSVTVIRRWSKAKIRQMIDDEDFVKSEGEALLKEMAEVSGERKDTTKELNKHAGIRAKGKFVQGFETWTRLKVEGDWRLCRVYYGGEKKVLGAKLCPYWCDLVPVISAPVEKVSGVFKGRAPVSDVGGLQILANDTINEGADTAHFSAMPIVMTDPEKNPRTGTMVLGLGAVWDTSPKDTEFVEFPDLWRSAMDRALAIKDQIFQTLGVNPSMVPGSTGRPGAKRNQAEIANEQQVDILTTADAVTVLEEGILTPLVQRFAYYDHQFRDKAITVRVYGEMGLRAAMEEVEPIQLNRRFEFRWWGVEAARNAAAQQQQIAGINVIKSIPKEMYPDYDLDIAPVIVQMTENLFGPRLAPQIFKRKQMISIPPELENVLLEHGHRAPVHEADDDAAHMQVHAELLQQGDPHGTVREHIAMHQRQMVMKQAAAQMQAMSPQGGGGGAPGGTPPGAMPAGPHAAKQPPGAVHPDQMARAGAVTMPRKT